MKKITLILLAALFATSAFSQDFSAGLRVGAGLQAVGQYKYNSNCYFEARFGASWINSFGNKHNGSVDLSGDESIGFSGFGVQVGHLGTRAADIVLADYTYYRPSIVADFTLLHNWRVLTMDWTPDYGDWFFDAGVGVNAGGCKNFAYVGVVGMARLGFNFPDVPLTLAVDWTPSFGPSFIYGEKWSEESFNSGGLANLGITCTYNF